MMKKCLEEILWTTINNLRPKDFISSSFTNRISVRKVERLQSDLQLLSSISLKDFFFDELKQLGKQLEELFETEEVDDDTQEKKEE